MEADTTSQSCVPASRGGFSRLIAFISLCTTAALLCGCEAVRYYGQAVSGEAEILNHQVPISQIIADSNNPPRLRAKLATVLKIRQFASNELKLPADKAYLKYVELHRPYVVWNVNVAPALSLEPKTWWFPVVGRASYRGYFSENSANKYVSRFATNDWDIYVDGIVTYSTLGWFRDPILNTFIDEPDYELAEIIFHELAHRRLFVSGDTDFNESFASAVATEGVRRWFLSGSDTNAFARYRAGQEKDRQFVELVMSTRKQLLSLYNDPALSAAAKLERKGEIIAQLRARHEQLKAKWGGKSPFDDWFNEPINNAKLNTISAYYDLVPAFDALLANNGGDLEKFYQAVAALAKEPYGERHRHLRKLVDSPQR